MKKTPPGIYPRNNQGTSVTKFQTNQFWPLEAAPKFWDIKTHTDRHSQSIVQLNLRITK